MLLDHFCLLDHFDHFLRASPSYCVPGRYDRGHRTTLRDLARTNTSKSGCRGMTRLAPNRSERGMHRGITDSAEGHFRQPGAMTSYLVGN